LAGLGIGLVASSLLLRLPALMTAAVSIITFGSGFAVFYMPQFIRFAMDYLGMPNRVNKSFGELLLIYDPKPPAPRTLVERELAQLWDYAYNRGSRDVIERVNMVVDSFMNFVRQAVRSGFLYGPLTTISYVFMLVLVGMFLAFHATALASSAVSGASSMPGTSIAIPFISGLASTTVLFIMLIVTGASASVVAGKAMHSIGLGVSMMPLFLAPIIALMGWA